MDAYILKFLNRKLFAVAWLLFVVPPSSGQQFANGQEEHRRDTLLYYHHDPTNDKFPDLIPDDSYMELYMEDGIVRKGFFWGTSDEFDDAREGYECGFFVLPLTKIHHGNDSITFHLTLTKTKDGKVLNSFVMAPVDLHIRSWKEAISRYKQWPPFNALMKDEIKFSISSSQSQKTEYSTLRSHFQIEDSLTVCNWADPSYVYKRTFVLHKKKHPEYGKNNTD
ncbi:MAG: hypothetical protein NC113_05485 [Bacteroides sp.]|nr:hypothetical protein [Bacteroides sp.]